MNQLYKWNFVSHPYDMYTHPDDEQQREAADTFERLLADGGGTCMLAACWQMA